MRRYAFFPVFYEVTHDERAKLLRCSLDVPFIHTESGGWRVLENDNSWTYTFSCAICLPEVDESTAEQIILLRIPSPPSSLLEVSTHTPRITLISFRRARKDVIHGGLR